MARPLNSSRNRVTMAITSSEPTNAAITMGNILGKYGSVGTDAPEMMRASTGRYLRSSRDAVSR